MDGGPHGGDHLDVAVRRESRRSLCGSCGIAVIVSLECKLVRLTSDDGARIEPKDPHH